MQDKKPLLSIVIPTKDRYKYLFQLIDLIEGYGLTDVEIIIQDNSYDNSEFISFLNIKSRPQLKYYHTKEHIPISQNIDNAIYNSNGEYVCLIGDDDGVLPNIINCVQWMKMNNIDALRPAITIFNWPDYVNLGTPELSGAVLFDQFSLETTKIDCIDALQNLANRGFRHIYTIPKVYQAIIKRSCLEKIYTIGKTYTPGPSPDMATAVALSFVVKNFISINLPVIIVGQSQFVGGGEKGLKGKVKDINVVPFLPQRAKENWDPRIPKVWCSQTVWPESAIKAIQYMNMEEVIRINYEFILAWFIITHPFDKSLAYNLSKNKFKLYFYLYYYTFFLKIFVFFRSMFFKKSMLNQNNRISNIHSILEASNYFVNNHNEYLSFDKLKL